MARKESTGPFGPYEYCSYMTVLLLILKISLNMALVNVGTCPGRDHGVDIVSESRIVWADQRLANTVGQV